MLRKTLDRSRWGVRHIVGAVIAAAILMTVAPAAARAATYTVGVQTDTSASACPSATETTCSLRQLILYVEAHPSPPDTIDVPAGNYTLNSSYGELTVTASMSIVGAGANTTTLAEPVPSDRSTSGDRVLDVSAPSGGAAPTVTVQGLALSGGDANSNNGNFGGDVVTSATLTLDDDWVTDGFACSGGGVANTGGTLTIERSLISANQAACASGGDDSGGVQDYGEPACSSCSPATTDQPGRLVVENSTITGNAARLGGGIFSWNDATNTVQISNSTIADNAEQSEGGNPGRSGAGGLAVGSGTVQVGGSILAANTSTTGNSNCSTAVSSSGHNLEDADTCGFTGPGDLTDTNPQLGALASNGGPTDTLALMSGSPALAQVPGSSCPATDQRGVARPTASACDIGAFELTPASGSTTTTGSPATTTASSGPTPTSPSTGPPASAPQTSFTVSSSSAGGAVLDASSTGSGDVSRYKWTVPGAAGAAGGPIYCPVQEPVLDLSASGPVHEPITVSAISTGNQVVSSATNPVSISSRLSIRRRDTSGGSFSFDGVCHGPVTITVPPLTPRKPAKPPRGSTGGAPPTGCTDDLDFGAVDVHGCLAEVSDPKDLPGGITAELGEAICSSTGLLVCLPSLVVGDGVGGLSANRSPAIPGATSQRDVITDLTQAGLPSYYSYSPVRLNGIDIAPMNGSPLLIIPSLDAIAGSSVELFLHGTQISPQAMPLAAYLPAGGGLLANLTLDHQVPLIGSLLPLTGAMSIYLYPAGSQLSDGTTCQYACAALHVNAALPDEFTGNGGYLLTAAGVIEADAVNGVNLSSLEVDLPESVEFAGIGVSNVVFRYRAADDLIYAQATLDLFPEAGDITATIEFVRGGFREGSVDWDAGAGTGIDLGGPFQIYLVHLGGGISLHPTSITANAKFTGGPQLDGCALAALDGRAQLDFAPFGFTATGTGSLLCQDIEHVYLEYGAGYFNVGGAVDLSFGPFSLDADVNLGIDVNQAHYQFDGDVDACLDVEIFTGCLGGEGVISDKGIGVCADLGFTHAGGGIVYPDHLHVFFDTCDIQTFRSLPKVVGPAVLSAGGRSAFPRALSVARTLTIPHGQRVAVIGVVGQGDAPQVTLVGPGGRTIDTPADGFVKTPEDVVIADGKSTHTTYFFVNHPAAGTWRVQSDPGSVAITAIRQASTLPDPELHARLHPLSGGRERLSYRLHPLAGQVVTFQEQAGKRGYDVIGRAHGAHGTVTFAPSLEMARTRTIVAMVTQNGRPRESVVLAHFTAPLPGRLAAPRAVHARRSDTSVSVRWQPVPGAGSYRVTVTAAKAIVRHAFSDGTTAVLAGLPAGSKLVVSVTARRDSPWAGAPGHATVLHLAAEKPTRHRIKLVTST